MKKVILALAFVFTTCLMFGINRANASTGIRSEIQKHKQPPKLPTPPKPKEPKKLRLSLNQNLLQNLPG